MELKVFYKTAENKYRVYDGEKVKTKDFCPKDAFEMHGKYTANKKGLKQYYKDISKDQSQLTEVGLKVNYLLFKTHKLAKMKILNAFVPWDFKMKSGKVWFHQFPHVNMKEFNYQKNCLLSGLIYALPGKYDNVVAVDRISFYPGILGSKEGDFHIPVSKPRYETLHELKDTPDYGLYRVKITCPNIEVRKFFGFSKNHTYTHYDLHTAKFLSTIYDDFKMELIQEEDNAMIYDETIRSREIFGEWFDTLSKFKKENLSNKLIKEMMNVWGYLCEKQLYRKTISEEKLDTWSKEEQDKYDFEMIGTKSGNPMYTAIYKQRFTVYGIARMKPFVNAMARKRLYPMLFKHKENVIRVYYDGAIFKTGTKLRQSRVLLYEKKYHEKDLIIENAQSIKILN